VIEDEPRLALSRAALTDPAGATFALIDPTDRVDPTSDLAARSARVDDPYDD
jgi:hypothetical protein